MLQLLDVIHGSFFFFVSQQLQTTLKIYTLHLSTSFAAFPISETNIACITDYFHR